MNIRRDLGDNEIVEKVYDITINVKTNRGHAKIVYYNIDNAVIECIRETENSVIISEQRNIKFNGGDMVVICSE